MDIFSIPAGEFTLQPKVLGYFGDFPISSAMATGLLITILVLITGLILQRYITTFGIPSKVQIVIEFVYSYVFNLVKQISGKPEVAHKIIPVILCIVLYIGIANTLSIVPILGSLQLDGINIFTTNTSDLNTTFGLAASVVLWTHFSSIRKYNAWNHINKFIKFKSLAQSIRKGPGQIGMALIDFFIGFLDIISEFAKSLSLSLRLFGNMFAGEVLASLLMSLFAIIAPVALMFMSLFTGVLQAIVFGALSAAYFTNAIGDDA